MRGRWEQYVGLTPASPVSPRLVLQKVDGPRPERNSIHLDLHVPSAAELPAAVARAVGLGATVVREVEQEGQH